jgi:hypothetical protein
MTLYTGKQKIGNLTDKSKPIKSKEGATHPNKEHFGKDSSGQNHVYIQEHKGKVIQSAGSPDAQRTGDYAAMVKEVSGQEAANTAIDSAVDQMRDDNAKTKESRGGKKDLQKSGCNWHQKMCDLKKCTTLSVLKKNMATPPPMVDPSMNVGQNSAVMPGLMNKSDDKDMTIEANVIKKYGKNSKEHQQYKLVMDEHDVIDRHGEDSAEHKQHLKHMNASGIPVGHGKAGLKLLKSCFGKRKK